MESMVFDKKFAAIYKSISGKQAVHILSIAESIGLDPCLIKRARSLVDEETFPVGKL